MVKLYPLDQDRYKEERGESPTGREGGLRVGKKAEGESKGSLS